MALAHCILGKFLGVGCHCFPQPLDVPTFSARCLHVQRREKPLVAEGKTLRGREMFRQISPRIRIPPNSRDLLHVANLRHGTDGFTSSPTEGVLRIFFALKNPTASVGFEPAKLGTKASTLTPRPSKLLFQLYPNKLQKKGWQYLFYLRHNVINFQKLPVTTIICSHFYY